MYSINQSTGALTSITTAIAAGTGPQSVACDPTGRFVYVANYGASTVSMYSINQSTGALTSITTAIATGSYPLGVACDPTGRFVYVVIGNAATVSMYLINDFSAGAGNFAGALTVSSTATASSTTTGALVVTGGVGIGGSLYVGGTVTATVLRTLASEIALGNGTGNGQGTQAVAIGFGAGNSSQGVTAVAIGSGAGNGSQGATAIAIGQNAGQSSQGVGAVAVGLSAGGTSQGNYSLALGYNAGFSSQIAGSIILSAGNSPVAVVTATNVGLYISPIRGDVTSSATTFSLYYNPVTKEITTATIGLATTATFARNIVGGTVGSLLVQTSTNSTGFVNPVNTSGYVLQSVASSVPQWVDLTPQVLNDISNQFDGCKVVFDLRVDQTSINTTVDSKDVEVVINGLRLTPYVDTFTYPWITPYNSFRGFRVVAGKLILYNAPYRGDSSYVMLRPGSTSRQKRRYPFSATTVALGD